MRKRVRRKTMPWGGVLNMKFHQNACVKKMLFKIQLQQELEDVN